MLDTLSDQLLMKVYILFSVFCVIRHVSEPQSNTDLTFELNILSLVLSLICFSFQIFPKMRNATLAFCILALTSSVAPVLLLPMYVEESVSSSGSHLNVTGLFFMLAFMILVLLLLMLSHVCVDTVFRRSVFFLYLLVNV